MPFRQINSQGDKFHYRQIDRLTGPVFGTVIGIEKQKMGCSLSNRFGNSIWNFYIDPNLVKSGKGNDSRTKFGHCRVDLMTFKGLCKKVKVGTEGFSRKF